MSQITGHTETRPPAFPYMKGCMSFMRTAYAYAAKEIATLTSALLGPSLCTPDAPRTSC